MTHEELYNEYVETLPDTMSVETYTEIRKAIRWVVERQERKKPSDVATFYEVILYWYDGEVKQIWRFLDFEKAMLFAVQYSEENFYIPDQPIKSEKGYWYVSGHGSWKDYLEIHFRDIEK